MCVFPSFFVAIHPSPIPCRGCGYEPNSWTYRPVSSAGDQLIGTTPVIYMQQAGSTRQLYTSARWNLAGQCIHPKMMNQGPGGQELFFFQLPFSLLAADMLAVGLFEAHVGCCHLGLKFQSTPGVAQKLLAWEPESYHAAARTDGIIWGILCCQTRALDPLRYAAKHADRGSELSKDRNAEQEISFEGKDKEKMELDDFWLRVKGEIKEEIEQEEQKEVHSRWLFRGEGCGGGKGPVAQGEGRPAAPGEARGHPGKQIRRIAGFPAQGAIPRGLLEASWAAVACKMRCWRFSSKFQGETQGPLGGGAGALLPSRCGVEEEAGEGEGKEGCKVQGEAWEEAAEISARNTNAKTWLSFWRCVRYRQSSLDMMHRKKSNAKSAFLPMHSFAITLIRSCFARVSSNLKLAARSS